MIWDWNNPIGLGLFIMMVTASIVLLSLAGWLGTRSGRRR